MRRGGAVRINERGERLLSGEFFASLLSVRSGSRLCENVKILRSAKNISTSFLIATQIRETSSPKRRPY